MRRTIKRPAGALTALALAASLALTGCGREATTEAGPGAGTAVDDSKASGTINVWAMGTEGEKLQDFVADFESANPDATVKVTAVPWEAAHDKISAAIASGKTPDVSLIGTTWMGEFAKAGGLDADARRGSSTRRTSTTAPGAPRSSATRRTASRGTSRRGCSTTAATWRRRPAGTRPRPPGPSSRSSRRT